MINTRALSLLLLGVVASPARSAEQFDSLRHEARSLDSLESFLERYVGGCRDDLARPDCEQNAKVARRGLDGRSYFASVGERTLDIVRVERTRQGYRFLVTPFIDGGGLALTNGAPRQQDPQGRPLISLLAIDGQLPSGMNELDLEASLRMGRLDLQVVFRPEGTWRLKRKGAPGFHEGVKARFLGLRLVESRTGAELGSRVF